MQIRCYRCGWSFALKREEISFAVEALEESGGAHYDVRCQRCRHTNKISLEQMKKFAPRVEESAEESESPPEAQSEPDQQEAAPEETTEE
jgi:phage FluMu protein Com